MRRLSLLKKKWSDEFERHHMMDTLQVYFVAFVWIVLFAIMFSTQGCAEKTQDKAPEKSEDLKDLVIQEPTKFPSSRYLVVNRLIFAREGRLITQGADLKIEANEILSDEGVIEPFGTDGAALPGMPGRNGGNITIKAKSGRGTLYIYGRGQNGGPGTNGLSGVTGKPGKQGKYALGTHEKVDVVCNCGNIAHDLKYRIEHSGIFDVIFAQQQFMMQRMMHRCISETGDGLPGEQGSGGNNGGNGGRGGDSARVYVELENASALQIKAYSNPGQGGAGGSGGQGGDGGRGGAPGDHNLDYFGNCRDAAQGPNGVRGDKGQPGRQGGSGNTLPMCIKLGTTTFGDCEKFNAQKGENQ